MLLNSYAPTGRRRVLVGSFCALAFLGGCDSREVTGPAPLATASDAGTSESASSLGSVLLRPTATSHPVEVANLPFQPIASIHARTWVVVRAHGGVTMTPIPDCGGAPETPSWVCGLGSGMPEFSSAAPTESGPVQVMASWSTGQARVPLRGAGGGAVGLLRAGAGVTLTGRLNLPGNYWYRVGEDPVPTYTFSGGYTVSAEAIGTPLRVQEGPADANGTREYSVTPLYGLQFVNPLEPYYLAYQPAGALTWKFVYGRNVADDGTGGIGFSYVTSCSGATVCRYTPSQSGRMVAGAFVEGQYVEMGSVIQRVVQPEMKLTCDAYTITRGERLECSVAADAPGATLTDIRWSFRDDHRHDIPGPPESRWGGTIVVGGTISVSAHVDGQPFSERTQRINVRPREWQDYLPPAIIRHESCPKRTSTCPQTQLTRERDTGVTFIPVDQIRENFRAEPVSEGPNAGWWYVAGTEPPITLPAPIVRLNPQLFDASSSFYRDRRTCRPADVQYWITRHEQVHVEIGHERARDGWINGALESMVEFRSATDPTFYNRTVMFLRSRLRDLLDPDHDEDRYPDAPTCINLAA
jgi:hypothetical protein